MSFGRDPDAGAKALAAAFSGVVVAAVLRPALENWRQEPRDSFPLSYYPMFSARRRELVRVTYLLGVEADGTQRHLSYRLAGPGGLNQVRRQLNRLVRRGRADSVARAVSHRLAARPETEREGVVEVRVVTGTFRLDDYFGGDRRPVSERVRAICPLGGEPA